MNDNIALTIANGSAAASSPADLPEEPLTAPPADQEKDTVGHPETVHSVVKDGSSPQNSEPTSTVRIYAFVRDTNATSDTSSNTQEDTAIPDADVQIRDVGSSHLRPLPVDRDPSWQEYKEFAAQIVFAGPIMEAIERYLKRGLTPVVEIRLVGPKRDAVAIYLNDLSKNPQLVELFEDDSIGPAAFTILISEPMNPKKPNIDIRLLWHAVCDLGGPRNVS